MVALALVVSACGGDDSSDDGASDTAAPAVTDPPATDPPATDPPATDPPATDPPATDPPATDPPATDPPATDPPATDPPATDSPAGPEGEIPQNNSGWALQAGADDITAGQVVVYWYRGAGGGNYVAVYTGAGIAGAAGLGLCPGNSIFTDNFAHVSNTPSEAGACDGFPTETASLQVCEQGVWIYETAIPGDLEGFLYGSLEWNSAGGIMGLYSQAETSPDMTELQPGLASYSVPPWFTDNGASVIECAPPIT
jgi:hypothetical protein